MNWLDGYNLAGDHFKASISLPENHPSGIVLFNRDPRSGKKKPDAYAGVILDAAPNCRMVKIGDNVVFKRWDWQQYDVNDEQIVAPERDLIIVNDQPAPGYVIFKLEDLTPRKTKLIVPHTIDKPKPQSLSGMVIASSAEGVFPGESYFFEQYEDDQFHYGNGLMAFSVYGKASLLAKYERESVLEVA